ncbi:MAG: hypothetical protein K6E27_08145 [Eubacterium sp.]|nr:hypothetical protein [Eubacterium sp.]
MYEYFQYDLSIPLNYFRYSVDTIECDLENIFFISESVSCSKNQEYEACEYEDIPDVEVTLFCDGNGFKLRIKGLISKDKSEAFLRAKQIVDPICVRLSYLLVHNDPNKGVFQPKLEPKWQDVVCKEIPFGGYSLTGCGGAIIAFRDSFSLAFTGEIKTEKILLADWIDESDSDDDLNFLYNEFYFALGTEVVTSKYLHLFAIIEWCEKKFEKKNASKRILNDDQVESVVTLLENNINDIVDCNINMICSRVKQKLSQITDIGRKPKLLNILRYMNITTISYSGKEEIVDIKMIDNLVELRNKLFHGGVTTKERRDKYVNAVTQLFYIDEQIIDYVQEHGCNCDSENE